MLTYKSQSSNVEVKVFFFDGKKKQKRGKSGSESVGCERLLLRSNKTMDENKPYCLATQLRCFKSSKSIIMNRIRALNFVFSFFN